MNYINNQNAKERLSMNSLSSIFMKKFLIFIGLLSLLIVSEYMLMSEFFNQKRPLVLVISLAGSIIFFIATYTFFKKYFLSSKHMEGHS